MEENCTEDRARPFRRSRRYRAARSRRPSRLLCTTGWFLGSSCGPISNPGWSGSSGGTRSSAAKDPACRILEYLWRQGAGKAVFPQAAGGRPGHGRPLARAGAQRAGGGVVARGAGRGRWASRRPEGAEGPGSHLLRPRRRLRRAWPREGRRALAIAVISSLQGGGRRSR